MIDAVMGPADLPAAAPPQAAPPPAAAECVVSIPMRHVTPIDALTHEEWQDLFEALRRLRKNTMAAWWREFNSERAVQGEEKKYEIEEEGDEDMGISESPSLRPPKIFVLSEEHCKAAAAAAVGAGADDQRKGLNAEIANEKRAHERITKKLEQKSSVEAAFLTLKDGQIQAWASVIKKARSTVVLAPTGFGKSLIITLVFIHFPFLLCGFPQPRHSIECFHLILLARRGFLLLVNMHCLIYICSLPRLV
jgi:hypothetical protein